MKSISFHLSIDGCPQIQTFCFVFNFTAPKRVSLRAFILNENKTCSHSLAKLISPSYFSLKTLFSELMLLNIFLIAPFLYIFCFQYVTFS